MAEELTSFQALLKEEIDRVKGVYYPVRAGFLRRIACKKAGVRSLHPNPEDEFCVPEIGPSYAIIGRYQRQYADQRDQMPGPRHESESTIREPIIVQKARPDGYMILNGHHRWAAAIRAGFSTVKIKIVNLTQKADIHKMLETSRSDKRVSLDLDEVVFCTEQDAFAEKPLRFPLNRVYKERVRKGIPALLHSFQERDYDIWVYTAEYVSMEYIRYFFKHWNVRLTGIVTGTARKGDRTAALRELGKIIGAKYRSTIHIDNDLLIRSFSDTKEAEEYVLSGNPETWAQEIMEIVRKLAPHES